MAGRRPSKQIKRIFEQTTTRSSTKFTYGRQELIKIYQAFVAHTGFLVRIYFLFPVARFKDYFYVLFIQPH